MASERFVKGTERLADPITAGSVHFLQQFVDKLPRGLQRAIIERGSQSTPQMGFVVDPYATFLFFEVEDEAAAAALLPPGFRLARTSVFEGDEEACYAIASFFRVHTSVFWGARAELYLVAEDERTGLLSWVIVDYLSDTISYDRAHGLRGPSATGAVITTTSDAQVMVDLSADDDRRGAAFTADLAGATSRSLSERLWVEGNLSVAYGPELSPDDAGVFALTFHPSEMSEALELPVGSLRLERMDWMGELLGDAPARIACFPFAQHLLSDSPGTSSGHMSVAALERAASEIDFESIGRFSTGSTKRAIQLGTVASLVTIASLALALIFG